MTEKYQKEIFVFFPCDGKIGGAERRLIRTFDYISKSNSLFKFQIGFLVITEINEDEVINEYRMFTDLPIMCFYSQSKIYKHVKKSDYDIVCYTDCSYRCLPILLAAKLSKKKSVMMCTDTMGSSRHLRPYVRQMLYDFDVKMSDRIDCLYPSNTKLLQSKFLKKTITCTPCSFTDMEKFKPAFPKKKEIVFLGRLVDFKGIRLFVNSMITIAQEIRNEGYQCYIYGHGELEEEIKATVSENNCDDIIHCLGHIPDSNKVLAKSRVFCSLQTMGNYPSQSMLEAMACGNYCIVTDTYDSYLLIDDSFGTLVNQDEKSFSDAVVHAMKFSEEQYKYISKNARDFLHKKHNIQLSAEYFTDLFTGLFNKQTE